MRSTGHTTGSGDRPGVPLSAKLIATTSIVVAVAVGASAYFGGRAIEELGRRDAAMRREDGERAIQRESELLAQKVAASVAVPLGNNTFSDVPPLLDAAQREPGSRGERRIQWIVVTDVAGQVVAQSGAVPDATRRAELAARVGDLPPGAVKRQQVGAADWVYGAAITIGASPIGRLHMGVSTAALDAELAASIREVEARAAGATRTIWLIAGGLLVAGVLLAALQGIGMARPLRLLNRQARRIADGNFDQRVPEDRRDEIGLLARSFNRMATDLARLLVDKQQKAVLERELDLAREVQQSMLPPPELIAHGALKIVGHCLPASSCGGDWWTFRRLRDGRLLIVVGDATGHGLHSAMISATARGAVEALAEVDERLLTPEQVLKSIDSAIRNVGDHNVLMTCFAAVLDPATAVLHYANAAQNFPYVIRMGANRVLGQASIVAAGGNPLGDPNIAPDIRKGSVPLHPGDLFVCFTDGVVERQSKSGKLFGDRRLRGTLHGAVLDADGRSLVELGDKVLAAIDAFADGTSAEDDITFVLCQFDPTGVEEARRRSA